MAFIEGDDSSNTLNGTAAADVIFGYGEDDTLVGLDGNDLLIGGSGDDTVFGAEGDDTLAGEEGEDWLHGGNGNDTVSYAAADIGVFVDLVAQTGSVGSEVDGYRSIENALGSSYGDVLFGDTGNNRLSGGRGDDLLRGGTGHDTLNGGAGIDTISYAGSGRGVDVRLAVGFAYELTPSNGVWTDTLSGIENVTGSTQRDYLVGDAYANVLSGSGGNDTLHGEGGADRLNGGTGVDRIGYSLSPVGVWIDLAHGTGRYGTAEGDTLISIEVVAGSDYADVLYGDAYGNFLYGDDGNDFLMGGGGPDDLDGGDGIDTVTYAASSAGVTIDLTNIYTTGVTASGGEAAGDYLYGIEHLILSQQADTVIGSEVANDLFGSLGNDLLEGGSGADRLYGGDGSDLLYGNLDADKVSGGAGTDVLHGGAGDDELRGEAGNDLLRGSTGQDSLFGGDGVDVLDFNALEDTPVGSGRDRVYGLVSGLDDIDLATIDANAVLAGDQAFVFIAGDLFGGVAGELRYNGSVLQGDVDGDAVADFQIQLYSVPTLVVGDLVL